MSQNILTGAEKERAKAEWWYRKWNSFTYGLYALGWTMTVLGIFLGGKEESEREQPRLSFKFLTRDMLANLALRP